MTVARQTNSALASAFSIERRNEPRVSVDILARLKSLDPVTSIGPSTIARIIEISHHGLKLRAGRKLMRGASVHIMAERKIFLGKVRYCLAADEDFLLGIQLVEHEP